MGGGGVGGGGEDREREWRGVSGVTCDEIMVVLGQLIIKSGVNLRYYGSYPFTPSETNS